MLEIARQREKAAADLAHTSVLLATKIARELLRAEIDVGHYDLERVVRDALAVSGVGRGACVVHLNPIDAERLKHVPFRAGLTIEADHEVARGDVHLTTPVGVLVRDIDDALEAIGEKIRGGLS
jgi:flagellar biosynthesis/type III secretory pathway protein FliH